MADFKSFYAAKKTKRDNGKPRHREHRFVSLKQGPAPAGRVPVPAHGDIIYCGSTKTFDDACRIKAGLDAIPHDGTVVLVYRFVRIEPQFTLTRTDVINSGERPRGEVVAYRLFRVAVDLAKPNQRGALADGIEHLLKTYGQTGDATGAGPR
jgi:hypothetical protein